MQLSAHFTLEEFTHSRNASVHGIDNSPPPEIVEHLKITARELEKVRDLLSCAITVTSGYRSPALNDVTPGSAKNSAHTRGWAVDFIAPAYGSPDGICEAIASSGIAFDQLIFEYSWVHISFEQPMRQASLTLKAGGGGYLSGIVA